MTLKKFVSMMFALTFVFALACGKGKEVSSADEGEDEEEQTNTAATTAAAATPAGAPAAAANPDAATISGTIKLEGTAPKMAAIQMSADPFCQSQHAGGAGAQDEEVVVGAAGELANVIVYVKNPPAGNFPAPTTPAVLDQQGCKYHPHVQAVQVGQPLQIKNSDATLHNVHAMPAVNSQFNEGQPVQGMVSTKKFDKPEMTPFRIKCDVHGWMKSYMAVLPHPFWSVSKMDGTFSIANLPAGTYTVVFWHEKYGPQEQTITVAPKETKQVSVSFKAS